ncbi:MAG TPA: ABC transporter substrate-binding protein [Chloroflexota bacterium]
MRLLSAVRGELVEPQRTPALSSFDKLRTNGPIALIAALFVVAGCTGPGAPASTSGANQSGANPVDAVEITRPVALEFWHRQVGASEALQQQLIDEFMAANSNIRINPQSLGNYDTLYQKTMAAIQAGSPPDMVAAYETYASDYYEAGALIPFDDYVRSPKYGLLPQEVADYIPSYMEATHFSQYGGKQLTFPYTKSDLVLFTNMDLLRPLGFQKPAATWDEFLTHCRAAVRSGRQCYAAAIDPSAFDGVVFSYGGEVISPDGKKALFDQPPGIKTLQLYETLGKEKLAYQIQGIDDQNDLVAGRALYMMRSSTSVPFLASGFSDNSKWEVSIIPQGGSPKPVTVLYGANISIMKSTPEKQLAAWLFIKWLTRPDVTARWGLDTSNGYFPVRQSALGQATAATFLDSNPRFKQALEVSRSGKVEPSARGWNEVRNYIADAMTGLITGKMTADQAQQMLMQKSAQALAS